VGVSFCLMDQDINLKLVKDFQSFLLQHNDLRDCGYTSEQGHYLPYTDADLQFFRNHPHEPLLEVFDEGFTFPRKLFRPQKLTQKRLTQHLVSQSLSTIWIINRQRDDTLLMLADVDDKNDGGDADGLAQYLSEMYLGRRTYIERSTGGHGRHVYFKVDLSGIKRAMVSDAFNRFAKVIGSDSESLKFKSRLDGFFGLPTLWDRSEQDRYVLRKRGNLLRLPYLPNGRLSLDALRSLVPLPFEALELFLSKGHSPAPDHYLEVKGDMSSKTPSTPTGSVKNEVNNPDALAKKIACISMNLRITNGTCALNQVLDDYHANYNPTGMTAKDIAKRTKKLSKLLEGMRKTFKPSTSQTHPFRKDEYLSIVTRLVTDEEFIWKRKERLDHELLSDFVSVKIQDAFFQKSNGYLASASRDATVMNMREMKAKGMIRHGINGNQYAKLLKITCRCGLLKVYEDYIAPVKDRKGKVLAKGVARMIGPGEHLVNEKSQFEGLYNAWKGGQVLKMTA
jgi:hypothetical protein